MAGQVKNSDVNYPDLIAMIESGVLKIPEFQRDFDWDMDRTLKLLDSLAKGYPIGAFLFWETTDWLGSVRNIGDQLLPEVPEGKEGCYVLDGQQRITSLYAAAKAVCIDGKSYQVYVDLDADPSTEEIFTQHTDQTSRFVELTDILGDHPHHAYEGLNANQKLRFDEVRDAFRFTHWPVIYVKEQPLEVVCEMFERVNRGGMELDLFDIMVAKTWRPDFNLRKRWEDFVAELEPVGFGGLASSTVLQALSAQLQDSIREQDILKINRDDIVDAWKHTTETIRRAIDYLRRAIPLPGSRFLPYPAMVVVFAQFVHANNLRSPDARQSAQLMLYYWRTGFSERYGSSPSSMIPQDLKRVTDIAEGNGEEMAVDWPVWREDVLDQDLRTGSAWCRTLLSVMAHARPRDIETGIEVVLDNSNLAQINSRHYHHIFPRKWLAKQGIQKRVNSIANIMLVPAGTNLRLGSKPPSQYMRPLAKNAGDAWRGWLRSHLINARAWEALQADDFEAFLRARSQTIADRANNRQGFTRDEMAKFKAKLDEED